HHWIARRLRKIVIGNRYIRAVFGLTIINPEMDIVAVIARSAVIVRCYSAEIVAVNFNIMDICTNDMRTTKMLDRVVDNVCSVRFVKHDTLMEIRNIVRFESYVG